MRDEWQGKNFWTRVLRKISRRRGREEAEDALQSAYERLLSQPPAQKVENVEAFLVHVAGNIAIDAHRRKNFQSDRPFEEIFDSIPDSAPLQDEVIEARVRLRHVEQGLQQLTPRTREVFLMHRLDGFKYREIAERLEISQSAVEKHIAKAVLFLAEWTRDR
ncbi:ECF subfamily RNA polymerase sigma-70 factor [Sphingopyxis sp. LC81]|uniref:RNA polymerase sigma factor n=1 Tax=Sphingopyxis sp. LC81 TaxID=1502850 RepID=UPI000510260E|nr:sigma-70 family RNA polymerase sigma factor [Sphingopyxis sp. LC81]KGB53905.1 ECF subfamily RNA polymerase sigma-70 factor [Sphingopyxis sp. LC81]